MMSTIATDAEFFLKKLGAVFKSGLLAGRLPAEGQHGGIQCLHQRALPQNAATNVAVPRPQQEGQRHDFTGKCT